MSVSCQMFSNFQSAGQSKRELLKLSGRGGMLEFHNMVTSQAVECRSDVKNIECQLSVQNINWFKPVNVDFFNVDIILW